MPRSTTSQRFSKQAARHTPTTKSIRFWFEGQERRISINTHDSIKTIYNTFATGICADKAIEIVREDGTRLQLGYRHLKDSGKIHVRRVNERVQGALGVGSASKQTKELLDKIVVAWGLKSAADIFTDAKFAPREPKLHGQQATAFDAFVPLRDPLAWTRKLTATMYQLSKVATRSERLAAIIEEAGMRHHTIGHLQQGVKEVMTMDIKNVVENISNIKIADNAVNVAYTENMVGGLGGALLEATLDGPSFTLVTRETEGGDKQDAVRAGS
jgi:hypothetical protein